MMIRTPDTRGRTKEQDADCGTAKSQEQDFACIREIEFRQSSQRKTLSGQPEVAGYPIGDVRSHHTGYQSRVVHDADAYDFHGKDSRCHGGSKQGGKGGAHTGHDHNTAIIFVDTQNFAQKVADASAQLQGRALTSGGTAEEMGQDRRDEDQRRCL